MRSKYLDTCNIKQVLQAVSSIAQRLTLSVAATQTRGSGAPPPKKKSSYCYEFIFPCCRTDALAANLAFF